MSKKLYEEASISDIADAIREKNETDNTYTVSQMPAAIRAIHTLPNLEPLSADHNGNYVPGAGNDGFYPVSVAVPNSYTSQDEGKVVKNGALVSQTSLLISENDTYDTTEINSVTVEVSGSGGGSSPSNILYGVNEPSSSLGQDKDIYLLASILITHVRMTIYKTRGSSSGIQICEIQLLDEDDNIISWPMTNCSTNANIFSSQQVPDKAFNNVVNSNDKWYTNTNTSLSNPIWIMAALKQPIRFRSIKSWRWYTGNDVADRDPITFDLEFSFDNGNTFKVVDHVENANVSNYRTAIGYQNSITTPQGISESSVAESYIKINGVWQRLIGSDINAII